MDIDLLWDLGGWFLINLDCMATLKSSSSISDISSKSHPFLFLALIFILLVLVHSSNDPSSIPSMATTPSKFSTQTTLIPHHSSASSTPVSSTTTMNLHHRKSPNSQKPSSSSSTTRREFEAGEHEVPSGPNPISN